MKSLMKSPIVKSPIVRTQAPRGRIARIILAVGFAGLFTAACKDSTDPGKLSTLTISPNPATVAASGTVQFTAQGTDFTGASVTPTPGTVVWSVVAGGGTISSSGLFTAGTTPGTFTNTVVATCRGISATATVIVTAGPLATITVTPNPTLAIGATQQFTAVGRDAFNNVVAITPVWSTVNPPGSIDASTGLFTAGNTTGTFPNSVRATSGAIFGTATVTVIAGPLATITVTPNPATMMIGATQQFTAVGRDAGGNVVPIPPPLVWSVDNPPGGGSIDASTGLFTAGAVTGTFTNAVRATSGAIFGRATVIVTAPPPPVINLGTASTYGILAGSTVTCVSGAVNADIGISPGSALVGFPPCVVTGMTNLANAPAAQAQLDLTAAYNQLVALPCGTVIGTGNIGGTTRAAGVYCSASSILVTGNLTLDGGGDPNAIFVFQAGSTLTTAGDVILINGAQAKNVYFQVGSSATIGVGSQWQGNILAFTTITLDPNANLLGRALARNGAVSLSSNNFITLPPP